MSEFEQLADAIDALPDKCVYAVLESASGLALTGFRSLDDLKALVADWREMDAERQAHIDFEKQLLDAADDLAKSLSTSSVPYIP